MKKAAEKNNKGMGRIKSKDTAPEMLIRKYLFSKGLRYRLHTSDLPGRPDIVLRRCRTVVLVNGCFWHAHEGCRFKKIPIRNSIFWQEKIQGNVLRDEKNKEKLVELGWNVHVVW